MFSQTDKEIADDEVLIILTPHILRFPGITKENLRRLASGTDSNVRVFHEDSDDVLSDSKSGANSVAPTQVTPAVPPAAAGKPDGAISPTIIGQVPPPRSLSITRVIPASVSRH